MRTAALGALADADVIVYLADARDGAPPDLVEAAALDVPPKAPILTVLNKVDAISAAERGELRAQIPEALQLSALTGEGVDTLVRGIADRLPESPFLYPEDDIGTQSLRFFASELVRETALEQLGDEVPYSIACEVEEFREERRPVYIRATLYVERPTQKQIVIGHKGTRIREIGRAARTKIEQLIDAPVYLDLWVKVLPNWRRNPRALSRFGYKIQEDSAS
jgi:GTP-binding protein Era